mgnify:CR=1 FL=1
MGSEVVVETDLAAQVAAARPRVFALCRRYVSDRESAEELAQDAIATALSKLDSYQPDAPIASWVLSIARNHCRNAVRKQGETLTSDGVFDLEDEEVPVLASLLWAEREEVLRSAAAAALTELEQEVVQLRYVEQLSQQAITEMLDLDDASGARGVLQRSRRKLARAIRARLVEMGHGSTFVRQFPQED